MHPSEIHVPLIYSGRVRRAIQFAEKAHRGINRKSGDHPYFLHLVAVSQVLVAAGADDDMQCAGFLHDVLEDTDISVTRMQDEFGQRVCELVIAVTKADNDPETGQPLTKPEKVALTEQKMADAPADHAALKGADLIANVSDLILDHHNGGYDNWQTVFGSREKAAVKVGHYLRLADIIIGRLAAESAYPVIADILRNRSSDLRTLFDAWEHA